MVSRIYSGRSYGTNPLVRGLGVRYLLDSCEGRLRVEAYVRYSDSSHLRDV